MKELEIQFNGTGEMKDFVFTQINRSPKAFVYEVTHPEGHLHYEVFERREQQATDLMMMGVAVHLEHKEMYPRTNYFGGWAFCITDKDRAIEKFNELTNKPDKDAKEN